MDKERLKTLFLSILVVISIILTQQLWYPSFAKTIKMGENKIVVVEERKKVISPKSIIASFGAGDRKKNYYTFLSSDIDFVWEQSKYILKDYFLGDPQITSIKNDTYMQANTLKSIELEFANNMPTILISSIFDSSDNKISGNIKQVKKILIPAFNRGTIYVLENKDNIYEVKLSSYEENSALVDFINKLENTDHIKFHPMSSLFEGLEENNTIMPINYNLDARQVFVESEIDVDDEAVLIKRSKSFFNENFDFVKTIKETSGATVYIYGYGEKSVRINNKGALDYNEEIGNTPNANVLASLDAALSFIYTNGGLPKDSYLKNIENVTNGPNRGYRFSFGYRIGGLPVEFNKNKIKHPIEIEVYGNKVKTYRNLVRKPLEVQGITPYQNVLYFPNIIENNIKFLESQYFNKENQFTQSAENKSLQILKDIEEVEMVYFDTAQDGKRQLLKPSWMIKIKKDIYYFDGYTGELINSVVLN